MDKNVMRFLLAAATGLLLSGCAALQEMIKEPRVSVEDMQVQSVSLSDMQLDFVLGVENPNPVGITLSGMRYNLEVEGKSLLSGDSREQLKVAAEKSAQLHLPLTLKYEEVFGGLKALGERETIRYALSGDLDLGPFRLPYRKEGEVRLPSLPSVSIARIAIERVGLTGLDISLGLQVSNSNDFPVKIDNIDYALKMAGASVVEGRSLGALSVAPGQSGMLDIGLHLGYTKLGDVIDTLRQQSRIPVALDARLDIPGADSLPLNWEGEVGIIH